MARPTKPKRKTVNQRQKTLPPPTGGGKKKTNGKVTQASNADAIYIFGDVWLLICQGVTAYKIVMSPELPKDVDLSLLVLCTSTIITLLQFHQEDKFQAIALYLTNIPLVIFIIFSLMLVISVFADMYVPWREYYPFVVSVAVSVPFRQFLQLLYSIFKRKTL